MGGMKPTTKKYINFVKHPKVEFRAVDIIPGIGPALREELERKGYENACEVVDKFRLCRYSTNTFGQWLEETCPSANTRHVTHCTKAMAAIRKKI